jgi:hypothetical protein
VQVKKEEVKKEAPQELTPEERLRATLKAKQDEETAKLKKQKEYMAEVMLYPHIYTYVYYLLLVACYTILQRPN